MWSVDTSFHLITSNAPFENLLKKSFAIEIKKGGFVLPSALPINLLEQYKKWYQRAFNGEYFSEVFYTQEPKDTWIENSFHPIIEDSQIVGTACHSRDITYLKKLPFLNYFFRCAINNFFEFILFLLLIKILIIKKNL